MIVNQTVYVDISGMRQVQIYENDDTNLLIVIKFDDACMESSGGAVTVTCDDTGTSSLDGVGVIESGAQSTFASIAITLLALMALLIK